jgi:eukaryotic-like serine/threonine-protein kinase
MGEVYRARDTRLDRTVAIKILAAELAQDKRFRIRFEREAKAISSLNHPHICALYDVGPDYLVMEHCEGKTLAQRIAEGALPVEQVLRYGMEIADALDKAHRQGIIHRDLKPSNVMITKSGVKLLDFGLAKQNAMSSPEESTLPQVTEEGKILGTIQYMAPELFHGREADARSDLFALGLVLYEMATGKPAFTGESKASLIAAILEHEPEPLKPATPPSLDRLIRACLVKDPDQRIQSAHDVKLQLLWILDGDAASPARMRPFARWIVPIVVAAAVAATAVTWFLARPRVSPSPVPVRRFSIMLPPTAAIAGIPAISRDGRWMVYPSSSDAAPLYVRSMDRGEVKPLPGTEGGFNPFFSPNGEWICFFDANHGVLKKIAIAGGAPILVCKTEQIRGATWLPDDTIVFGSMGTPLLRVSSGGGRPQELTKRSTDTNFYWPSALPDGQHVLYTIGSVTGNYDQARIAVLSLRDGRSQVILEGGTSARHVRGHLVYSHSGTLFAVPFDTDELKVTGSPVPIASDVAERAGAARGHSPNGASYFGVADDGTLVYVPQGPSLPNELVWVDRKGVATPVSNIRREYESPQISPDGGQIAVQASNDVWLFDLRREAWTRLTTEGQNGAAVWSLDGRQIFFASNRNGPFSVYAVPSDGSQLPRQLTHDQKSWTFPAAISRDGRSLVVFRSQPGGASDLYVVDPSQPDAARPFLTAHKAAYADLSPDAHWIAFSLDETGRDEIYVGAFPSLGRKWPVSIEGGTSPRFRADGRELFYRSGDKMMAVDISLGPEPRFGKPRMLFEGDYDEGFDVMPDGQRFVMLRSEKRPPAVQLNVVTGLFDNLKP